MSTSNRLKELKIKEQGILENIKKESSQVERELIGSGVFFTILFAGTLISLSRIFRGKRAKKGKVKKQSFFGLLFKVIRNTIKSELISSISKNLAKILAAYLKRS